MLCASGVTWRRLDAPGIDALLHAGVYYGSATSEAQGVRDEDVIVVGGGNSAGQAVMFLSEHTRRVWLLLRGGDLRESMSSYLAARVEAARRRLGRPLTYAEKVLVNHLRDAAGQDLCSCPDGFICAEVLTQGGPGVVGSYCVKSVTEQN